MSRSHQSKTYHYSESGDAPKEKKHQQSVQLAPDHPIQPDDVTEGEWAAPVKHFAVIHHVKRGGLVKNIKNEEKEQKRKISVSSQSSEESVQSNSQSESDLDDYDSVVYAHKQKVKKEQQKQQQASQLSQQTTPKKSMWDRFVALFSCGSNENDKTKKYEVSDHTPKEMKKNNFMG